MKRIANNVAVQTILYTINPQTKVKIVDYENTYDLSNRQNGKEKFFGKAFNLIGAYKLYRETEATLHGTNVEMIDGEPVIVFSVCTKFEEYK